MKIYCVGKPPGKPHWEAWGRLIENVFLSYYSIKVLEHGMGTVDYFKVIVELKSADKKKKK